MRSSGQVLVEVVLKGAVLVGVVRVGAEISRFFLSSPGVCCGAGGAGPDGGCLGAVAER